jgi:hypothetical protein
MTLRHAIRGLTVASVAAATVFLALRLHSSPPSEMFDVVIANGRVMDPESGLDGQRMSLMT